MPFLSKLEVSLKYKEWHWHHAVSLTLLLSFARNVTADNWVYGVVTKPRMSYWDLLVEYVVGFKGQKI
jgi:hypothetical protein